jgi:alanine dehydrogenase
MKIGCVKEIKNNEFRVGLTPDNVKAYVAAGHHVYIEKSAGAGSGFLRSCWCGFLRALPSGRSSR